MLTKLDIDHQANVFFSVGKFDTIIFIELWNKTIRPSSKGQTTTNAVHNVTDWSITVMKRNIQKGNKLNCIFKVDVAGLFYRSAVWKE